MKKRIGILGASGYAGYELFRILSDHEFVDCVVLNSETCAHRAVRDLYSEYDGSEKFTGYPIREIEDMRLDLLFCAREPGFVGTILPAFSCKVIDMSCDLRFNDGYTYGLPELYRSAITTARVVANPGCYATAALLATCPIARYGGVRYAVFTCMSGYSGAGRTPSKRNDPAEYRDNVIAYQITKHRHIREISACLSDVAQPVAISFTPHVVPVFRGILCTAHVQLKTTMSREHVLDVYRETYLHEPFVKVLDDRVPDLHDVQGTDTCWLGGFEVDATNQLVIIAAIDNLRKGASGQAVQNMNLMLGFSEDSSLTR